MSIFYRPDGQGKPAVLRVPGRFKYVISFPGPTSIPDQGAYLGRRAVPILSGAPPRVPRLSTTPLFAQDKRSKPWWTQLPFTSAVPYTAFRSAAVGPIPKCATALTLLRA